MGRGGRQFGKPTLSASAFVTLSPALSPRSAGGEKEWPPVAVSSQTLGGQGSGEAGRPCGQVALAVVGPADLAPPCLPRAMFQGFIVPHVSEVLDMRPFSVLGTIRGTQ